MKRLIGLSVAVILGVTLTTVMLIPRKAHAVSSLLMGTPQSIEFETLDTIQAVVVQIKKGWVNSEQIELEIKITSVNGTNETHGHEVVPISAGTLFPPERDVADVRIDWSTFDTTPITSSITYTVEVQVLAGGQPLGEPKYNFFTF
jgi:hypothetical protein